MITDSKHIWFRRDICQKTTSQSGPDPYWMETLDGIQHHELHGPSIKGTTADLKVTIVIIITIITFDVFPKKCSFFLSWISKTKPNYFGLSR